MQRRGGKRIRMDDPPPPEYESPMTPLDGSGTELQEPYTSYTPYSNQPATPCIQGMSGILFLVFISSFRLILLLHKAYVASCPCVCVSPLNGFITILDIFMKPGTNFIPLVDILNVMDA